MFLNNNFHAIDGTSFFPKTIWTIKLDTWARHWAYTFIIIIIIDVIIIVLAYVEVTIYQNWVCEAVHGVNIMYSTCNGSNDEFEIDYGGLSLKHTIDR